MDYNRCADSVTAAEVINHLDQESLEQLFRLYGNEKYSRKYSGMIVDSRFLLNEIRSTSELAYLISSINSDSTVDPAKYKDNHSSSKIVLVLRIFVNNELNELNYLLEHLFIYLKKDERLVEHFNGNELTEKQIVLQIDSYDVGKLAVISFNEQEDQIVKRRFNDKVENTRR